MAGLWLALGGFEVARAKLNVFVVGYPKSGTLWLARLLGDALNSPITTTTPEYVNGLPTEGAGRQGPCFVRHGHALPDRHMELFYVAGDKIVYIVRDPRDVVVSSMFYWKYNTIRESVAHVVACKEAGGISAHVTKWQAHPKVTVYTSYEALREDTRCELLRILRALEIVPVNALDVVVQRQSFEQRKAWTMSHGDELVFGKEVQLQYLRKGIVGDWRNHFTYEDGLLMQERLGDLMLALGYVEPGECWWEGLPHE